MSTHTPPAGLALVIPSVQSLTADYYPSADRGKAFGALWLTISFGGMLGALYATNTAAHNPLGIEGWRFVFLSVAAVSAVAGTLNQLFAHDPTFARRHQEQAAAWQQQQQQQVQLEGEADEPRRHSGQKPGSGPGSGGALGPTVAHLAGEVAEVLRIPTFCIIIVQVRAGPSGWRGGGGERGSPHAHEATHAATHAQGIVGSVPYASLIFLTLYFQLMGMSNAAASGRCRPVGQRGQPPIIRARLAPALVCGVVPLTEALAHCCAQPWWPCTLHAAGWGGCWAASLATPRRASSLTTAASPSRNSLWRWAFRLRCCCSRYVWWGGGQRCGCQAQAPEPATAPPPAREREHRSPARPPQGLPMDGEPRTVAAYAVTMAAFALLTAWPAPACNNPVFAEVGGGPGGVGGWSAHLPSQGATPTGPASPAAVHADCAAPPAQHGVRV